MAIGRATGSCVTPICTSLRYSMESEIHVSVRRRGRQCCERCGLLYSSNHRAKFQSECDDDNATNQLPKETVVCHQACVDAHETNSEIGRALRRGCYVALTARKAVLDTLGFTLSAGISTNKLVSKLAASYGKPNGQVRELAVLSSLDYTYLLCVLFS